MTTDDGDVKIGVQVIALGRRQVPRRRLSRRLARRRLGQGGDKKEADGELKDGVVRDRRRRGGRAKIKGRRGDSSSIRTARSSASSTRSTASSPTLGAKPPEGAVVLFDGKSADAFEGGKVTEDGLLACKAARASRSSAAASCTSSSALPYQPEDRGQGRGNSGIYRAGRGTKCQMLDSFGLEGKNNECGGIYSVKAPDVNMCLPPLAWQTYDIDYTAAKYDGDKLVTKPAGDGAAQRRRRSTRTSSCPASAITTAAPIKPGPEPGPIYLQDHGNPVRYRNIWVVETK